MDSKFAYVLLLALALAQPLFAAIPLAGFLNSSFEPGMAVEAHGLMAQGNFSLISLDGNETYVFDNAAGTVIIDRQKIIDLLVADAKNRSGYSARIASAHALPAIIAQARNRTESQCMLLTGTDMHPCTDKDTCVLACMSNPNCANPLYSDGFWEAILDWSNARRGYDSALLSYANGLDAIAGNATAVEQKMAILAELSSTAQNMSNNPIFLNRTDEGCSGKTLKRCYEYCPKIDYSRQKIETEKQSLAGLKAALLLAESQPARADAIINASGQYDDYLSTRKKEFEELRLKMANDVRKANSTASELAQKVNDTQIAPAVVALSNYSAQIITIGNSGRYRAALAMKKEYARQLSDLNDRIGSDLLKYSRVLDRIENVSQKADKGGWLLGNQTATDYKTQLDAIRANLTSAPATLQGISDAAGEVESIDSNITEAISAKATDIASGAAPPAGLPSGIPAGVQIPPGTKLPCLPSAIIFVLGLAIFLRR